MEEIIQRQLILIKYLQELINNYSEESWKVKAEYSTNDNDDRVVIVQEQMGEKQVFYGEINPLYNYYSITIFGFSLRETKNLSLLLGYLIGKNEILEITRDGKRQKWQIMFIQNMNPQLVEYKDIRRVGYDVSFQCVINKIWEESE